MTEKKDDGIETKQSSNEERREREREEENAEDEENLEELAEWKMLIIRKRK